MWGDGGWSFCVLGLFKVIVLIDFEFVFFRVEFSVFVFVGK